LAIPFFLIKILLVALHIFRLAFERFQVDLKDKQVCPKYKKLG